VLYNP